VSQDIKKIFYDIFKIIYEIAEVEFISQDSEEGMELLFTIKSKVYEIAQITDNIDQSYNKYINKYNEIIKDWDFDKKNRKKSFQKWLDNLFE